MQVPQSDAPSPPPSASVPHWTVVGSGTLLPHGDRGSPAHLLEWGGEALLLDCGPGTVHGLARAGCPWREVRRIWVSHFHPDHLADLPGLAWAWAHGGRSDPLRPVELLGPPGLLERWNGMVRAFGGWMASPGGPLLVREVEPGASMALSEALVMETLGTTHTEESQAVRFREPGGHRSVVYTSDTGSTPSLVPFMEGASLVVAACARPDPPGDIPHLTPGTLAPLLEEAGVGLVVTTHAYPELPARKVPDLLKKAGYTGQAVVAHDGLRLPVPTFEA
ncbi:MAG: ribonuclease Z [Gemmatimonadales bacterium]|nr:MAG: ribonuclease Z [Gemmatimonadales bacterium]